MTAGAAKLGHTFTTTGAHSITAVYSGTAGFDGSTAEAQTIEISSATQDTTTTLQVPPTANKDAVVTLTATVNPQPNGGTVQFKDGGVAIGGPVAVSGGNCLCLPHDSPLPAHMTSLPNTRVSQASVRRIPKFRPSQWLSVQQNTTTVLSAPVAASTSAAVDLTAVVSADTKLGNHPVQRRRGEHRECSSRGQRIGDTLTSVHRQRCTQHLGRVLPAVQNSAARSRHPRPWLCRLQQLTRRLP